MIDAIVWVLTNLALAPYHLVLAILNPGDWLFWENREALARFIYYGGSVEFFFVVFTLFLVLTAIGLYYRNVMWGMVRGLEAFANPALVVYNRWVKVDERH